MKFKEAIQKLSKFAPKNAIQKLGTTIGTLMFFFGIWQMDLVCVNPIFFNSGYTGPEKYPFKFGFPTWMWTTWGNAYDICQVMIVTGFLIVLISLWLWDQ